MVCIQRSQGAVLFGSGDELLKKEIVKFPRMWGRGSGMYYFWDAYFPPLKL